MIHDSLKNATKYLNVHPMFKKAFNFLNEHDLNALENGKIELEGSDMVVNIVDITGKDVDTARMETHNEYLDIQVPVNATEIMGWKAAHKLAEITESYNKEKDVTFFGDKATSFITVEPYEFAIFFPEDGHQPGIGTGNYRKIIIKIKV